MAMADSCDVRGAAARHDDGVTNAPSRSPLRSVLAALTLVLVSAIAASAQLPFIPTNPDVTVFIGPMIPTGRPAIAVAIGDGGSMVRIELEYAGTLGTATSTPASAGSLSCNILVQSRPSTRGVQFYGTVGYGLYGETYEDGISVGDFEARNIGGGAKIKLAGPLRMRLDYRIFMLSDIADISEGLVVRKHPQRFFVGLNLGR
jgi:hypothetical protein